LLLAAACRATPDKLTRGQPDEHAAEGTLIVGKAGDAMGLDPARVSDDESVEVAEQIFEHLVRYRPASTDAGRESGRGGPDELRSAGGLGPLDVEPQLAVAWEVDPHGTVWTFHLRPGVRFHDGTPLDAEAVVFSLERQRDPFHPYHHPDFAYWRDQYSYIEKIEAVDRLTVRIRIERPYAPFLSSLAMFPASIVSPTAVRRWGKDFPFHPVGTGPFRFESWQRGDRIVIARNDDYWGPKPRVARIVFRAIADARQRLVALEGQAVDVAYGVLPEELQYVKLHPDLRLHQIAVNNVAYLAMNTTHPPFDDVDVRRAVNQAVNKVPIVKLVYQGLAVPAAGPVPPSLWGHHADVQKYPYDPSSARAVLMSKWILGLYDRQKRYQFYVPKTPRSYLPDPEQVARVIQRNLEEVGITTDLVVQDFAAHDAALRASKHDLCLFGWTADNGDPDNFLKVLLDHDENRRGPEQNDAFYRSAELHGLLTYAEETFDPAERLRYYRQAQEIVARDAPWVPLAHSQLVVAARAEVHELSLHPTSTVYYDKVWLSR
jgi:peptide/nickel transport system substrate-binding protein